MSIPLLLAMITSFSPVAGQATTAPPPEAPARRADPPQGDRGEKAIAGILGRGFRLGDPFPLKNEPPPIQNYKHDAEARSTVRLAAVAHERGLDRSPDVVRTVEAARQMLLAEKLMQTMSDSIVVDENEVRAIYDGSPDKYDEFELAHIFLSAAAAPDGQTSDAHALQRARDVYARIKAGEDFASLARSFSDDKETAADGGVLPTILGVNIQPVFMNAVRTMKPNEVSGIVKGDQGYHIVMLVTRRHVYSGPPQDLIENMIREREMHKLLPELNRLEEEGA